MKKLKYILSFKTLLVMSLLIVNSILFAQAQNVTVTSAPNPAGNPPDELDNRDQMKKLWIDNVMYTRMYLMNEGADNPDKSSILNKLRMGQKEIAKIAKSFHPGLDESKFSYMLDSTVLGLTVIIFKTNVGLTNDVFRVKEGLMKYSFEIAKYLNTVNSDLFPVDETKTMFQTYINETHNEILARNNKAYEADMAAFDRAYSSAVRIADGLIKGVPKGNIQAEAQTPPPAPEPAPSKKGKKK